MEKDKRISRARQFIRELVDEENDSVEEENPSQQNDLYELLLFSECHGQDLSSQRGFNLMADNDTTRLLRELLY